MTDHLLGPLVSGHAITSELRQRKKKDVYKTITGPSKKIIAQKVTLKEEEGWRTVKTNLKSTRMAKAKPSDEQLEDEVWCTLAEMGFKEMSSGRRFSVPVEDGQPSYEIDVFAKDDETVIVVECARCATPRAKSMSQLIEKIRAGRENFLKSFRRTFGPEANLNVGFVIATRNISWDTNDISKCKDAQIKIIADAGLDYYAGIVQHLKHAARYQFLAHIFADQKIEGLGKEVLATRGKMGDEVFYTFLIRADELLKIAYVGHKASRDIENLETYQRMLQPRRLKKIAAYINAGGKFPTNIVVNLKTTNKAELRFDVKESYETEALGVLHLPPNYASAWIIDGQHRLYGYAHADTEQVSNQDSAVLPVLAYENLPAEKEVNLFIDINSKQVKVSTGLLVELYANLHWRSSDAEEAFQALLSRVAGRLNTDQTSPLYDRMVVTGKRKTQYRCLTQTSIRDGLSVAKLLGTFSRGEIVPGPLSTSRTDEYELNLTKALSVISKCLRMFSSELKSHWIIGDGSGGYLCTNNGIRALFHVIKDVADHAQAEDKTELCLYEGDETFRAIERYLETLVEYFRDATIQEIMSFRRTGSSLTAVRQQAYGMEAIIQEKYTDFSPTGLREYLNSRNEAGSNEARRMVFQIQKRIFSYIIGVLKKEFGVQDKAWWVEGVPVSVRVACSTRWEEKDREGTEEGQLFLQNYVKICIQNWDLVKDVISLEARDKGAKTRNTQWITELNEIRNKVSHPERGILSVAEINTVRRIYESVEKFFPDDVS